MLARLEDITSQHGSRVRQARIFFPGDSLIDRVEYAFGMERGEIDRYRKKPMLAPQMHEDMEGLMHLGTCCLLPSIEILRSLVDIVMRNHGKFPNERDHFLSVIPEQEFEYEVLPIVEDGYPPLLIGDDPQLPPYSNRPRVKTRLHPVFSFSALKMYVALDNNERLSPDPITEEMQSIFINLGGYMSEDVWRSWLGPGETWRSFHGRPCFFGIRDLVIESDEKVEGEALTSHSHPSKKTVAKGAKQTPKPTSRASSHSQAILSARKSVKFANLVMPRGRSTVSKRSNGSIDTISSVESPLLRRGTRARTTVKRI